MLAKNISLRLLTSFVLVYMVLAFGWWAIELWRENERVFEVSYELLETRYGGKRQGLNITELEETAEFRELVRRQEKHQRMILGEGVFFTLCLAFGLYVINRAANREMELARQRRNFLLSITHELKSPIAALRLTLETFCKRDLQREQVQKLCANGLQDAKRLQHLVEDLLLAARLEDNWHPHAEDVDLKQIAHASATSLQTRFPNAKIRIDIPEGFPTVSADKPGLTAVVANLLENAVKYAPEGAEVILSAQFVKDKLQIRVADQGIGIPDVEKQVIFEKFYRVGNEETRRTTGTGLGLYIVDQVVKAHKGTITVSNNSPQGTIFTVTL
ncbi:MAG: sensor histidine kinase [Bacteroidetes bacterium]|nr:MAG: sensor histidine kinase [Bacteroidota bacterium]